MRIRKRSGDLFTSSSSWERARSSTSSIAISSDGGNGEEEFLLPPVAAVMDVQRAEGEDGVEGEGDHGTRVAGLGTHPRPAHNWRNALQVQRRGEENTKSQALEDGGEGNKLERRWNGCRRNECDNIKLFTNQGTQGVLFMNEDTSSSAEKEMTGCRDEEWQLPKSGLPDMGNSWRQQKNPSVHSVKRKIHKDEIGYIKGWKDDETKTTKKPRQEIYSQQEDGRKMDHEANKIYVSNNEGEGSQCRRRNGRGWRCSQRTVVGYSLCEHHLGKSKLKSINSNYNKTTTVTVKNKAGTCKLKKLSLINTS